MVLVIERFMNKLNPYLRELSLDERKQLEKEVTAFHHSTYTLAARRGQSLQKMQSANPDSAVSNGEIPEPSHYTGISVLERE